MSKLTHDEKLTIVDKFFVENLNYKQIGEIINRPAIAVTRFLNELMKDSELKKKYFPTVVENIKTKKARNEMKNSLINNGNCNNK